MEYFYDNNGNILSITEKMPDGETKTLSRTYDCMNRVSTYTDYKGNTVSYGYDEPGNVSKTTGIEYGDIKKVTSAEYKYDAANRLISYNGEEVKYDADGNMIYGPLDSGMASYEYDCRNRLVRDGDTTYEYDAEITGLRLILQNKDWKQYRKNMQHYIQQWKAAIGFYSGARNVVN